MYVTGDLPVPSMRNIASVHICSYACFLTRVRGLLVRCVCRYLFMCGWTVETLGSSIHMLTILPSTRPIQHHTNTPTPLHTGHGG